MMKIRYCSDLHIEFSPQGLDFPYNGEDVLVLAGDINVKARVQWIRDRALEFPHVIYVCGNHEYYKGRIDKVDRKIREFLADSPNVHILQNQSVTLEGVTFHGATLWTDCDKGHPLTIDALNNPFGGLPDFRLIKYKDRNDNFHKFRAQDSIVEHMISRLYLSDNVKEGDVVITHHAPCNLSSSMEWRGHILNGGFFSDLSDIMLDNKPALWFHGHMHNTSDYMIGDCRVLCNPRGYDGIKFNDEFDIEKIVEIENE